MPRIALKPGENSIATSTAKRVVRGKPSSEVPQRGKGTWELQWHANIAGETKRHMTRVHDATKTDCYAAANRLFDELIAEAKLPGDGHWTRRSRMAEFVNKVAIPAIEANKFKRELRPRSIDAYVRCLRRYAEQVGDMRIGDAVVPNNIETHLKAVATSSGNSTASQTRKVVSRYVFDLLARRQIIAFNPCKLMDIEATVGKNDDEADDAERTLTPDERRRVVDHLLSLDPTTPARKRWSSAQMTAKRSTLIDMTLVQATCGLRLNEARHLATSWLGDDGCGHLTVTVPKSTSKTVKSRTVPLLDDRVAERIRERAEAASDAAGGLIFASPVSGSVWDASNVSKAARALYDELADELDMPVLRNVLTHVWRRTLNSEWMDLGVSVERRAAYFGHSSEVNQGSYTDFVDLSQLVEKVDGRM